ncbi:DUF6625 family protein [Pedobacter sp. SL55]|uniref:DUF6625 family protein n=1 Tax=Pedobacter sp. SL55 TaxID=2995161 RepID=UPI002271CAD1|nr:DUF6625 family protein [Pedobacter sp. SL55]WAC41397.1 hypothetical protein OVA16_03260 [Pedobacter sp. SL55]
MSTIIFIVCYMGKLPWYVHHFLHSCNYNLTIDFLLVTDDRITPLKIPNNVTVTYKDLSKINELGTKKLNLPISIKNGYKLCDFKPAYGKIFEEDIAKYDYWGYGDLDVIFGDIRAFITDHVLQSHDIISVRHDFLTGYFQLFKNNEFTRSLYKESRDYKKVFTNDKHYCFDETNFTHKQFTDGLLAEQIDCEIDSMMHVVKRLEKEGRIKAYFDFHVIEGLPGKLKWQNGKLYYRNKYEVMLYHLIMFKLEGKSNIKIGKYRSKFHISPTTIY